MDDRTLHLVPIPKYDENMRSLSLLVIRKYFPDGELSRAGKNHQEKWELWNIMLSELDYAVCMQLLMDYSIAYDKHRQEAFIAWINVNGLVFPKEGETSEEPLDEVTLAKIRAQAKLVEKVNVNKKLK
jgi:hypothetical protein